MTLIFARTANIYILGRTCSDEGTPALVMPESRDHPLLGSMGLKFFFVLAHSFLSNHVELDVVERDQFVGEQSERLLGALKATGNYFTMYDTLNYHLGIRRQ